MKLKVLIIGATGQVGGALLDVLKKNKDFQVFGSGRSKSGICFSLDITKKREVDKVIEKIKPNLIMLPAAFTNVEACESKRSFAHEVNVKGVENVVLASKENLSKLVYFSTAYVFDGRKGDYKEDDKKNPINFYGKTKTESEEIIQKELNDYLIVRTNWVFDIGYDQKNFIFFLLRTLKQKGSLRVPDDQYGNPTLARNIAWAVEELIQKNKKGIYHIVGKDKMSKYQWARRVAEYFNLNHELVVPVSSKELGQKAPRPQKDDLNIEKTKRDLKTKLLSLEKSLDLIKSRVKL